MDECDFLQSEYLLIGQWQHKITTNANSKTFCILPWIHFATRPNGDMRLCCGSNASGAGVDQSIGLVKNDKGVPANFGRETPLSAWNNEYMRNVRTTMLSGNIPASCTKCFKEEKQGIASKRLWETYTWMNDVNIQELIENTKPDGTIPEVIPYLDLRLGHNCNIKCIMCSPHDSSRWVQDHKKIFPIIQNPILKEQISWDEKFHNNYWHENPAFWEEMYEQIPNLKQVYFAGGEPLMIKEHKLFLQEIIKQGYADKILVRYNTNGLLIDQDIIDLWKKFKKVKVGFSIDAVGEKNHYIRYPSDWNIIERNLDLMDNTPDNIQCSIATAIQILNIKHLADFARWKITRNFKKINLEKTEFNTIAGGGIFNMHLVYIPVHLSIKLLPEHDKREVREKFRELKDWLYENYRQDEAFFTTDAYGWKRWEAVLDFMDSEDQTHLLPVFKEYIEKIDPLRDNLFKTTFPELSHLVNPQS